MQQYTVKLFQAIGRECTLCAGHRKNGFIADASLP